MPIYNDLKKAREEIRSRIQASLNMFDYHAFDDDYMVIEHLRSMIVVTRHQGLVDYLRKNSAELCIPTPILDVVFAHVEPEDVEGKHVFGVLPLRLAALADKVTEVPLALEPEDRGRELSAARVAEIAGPPITYQVSRVKRFTWEDDPE